MNAWSHLPNAAHIDRVVKSVKSHPEVWSATWDAIPIVDAARGAAGDATRNSARGAARGAAWDAAWSRRAWGAAWAWAAGDTILALVAYDDAAKYLDMPSDQLRVWAILSEEPAAVLLLPAVIAYEKIDELELV